MLRAVSPVGPGHWYAEVLFAIRAITGGIRADQSSELSDGWVVTRWKSLPGIYCISHATPSTRGPYGPTALHFVAVGAEAELWLMLNLPPQATVEEVSRDQYPAACFR